MHRGIELSVQGPMQPVQVQAEVLPLTQALVQVMRNAMNAVQGQTVRRINLTLSVSEREACIEVLDSGPGLPAHLLGQSSQGAQLVQDWLGGLGLYMTHGILSQLGGRMALDNPESGGARVRLTLPLIHAAPSWAS
jgi:C4-dicarboxylate-specific signal transduction histidine kinase